jgi:hypothetical protein
MFDPVYTVHRWWGLHKPVSSDRFRAGKKKHRLGGAFYASETLADDQSANVPRDAR